VSSKPGAGQGIINDRKAVFEPRWNSAYLELRQSRDGEYQEILGSHREQRQTLKWHQELGLDTSDFFQELRTRHEVNIITEDFREASVTATQANVSVGPKDRATREFADAAVEAAEQPLARVGSVAASVAGSFFTALINFGSPPPEPAVRPDKDEMTRLAGEEATKHRDQIARDLDDEDWRKRSRELHGRERYCAQILAQQKCHRREHTSVDVQQSPRSVPRFRFH